ncbi:hypothetical protein FOMPIDRAFT_1103798, partial [Fomitopsis schrenkii]
IMKIVNALSAMQQVGAPAACAFLLGNPDHYTDQMFKSFYWTSYVSFATDTARIDSHTSHDDQDSSHSEKVLLSRHEDNIVAYYRVNDYIYHPHEYQNTCLYNYLTTTVVRKIRRQRSGRLPPDPGEISDNDESYRDEHGDDSTVPVGSRSDGTLSGDRFLHDHPLHATHNVCRVSRLYILNFIGPVLPRKDAGDREMYCRTMLVFFKPNGWRTETDICLNHASWEEAFHATTFAENHVQIMRNMNVLYECLDARDDYAA